MAGYLYNNVCYTNLIDAQADYYAGIQPIAHDDAGTLYLYHYRFDGTKIVLDRFTPTGSGQFYVMSSLVPSNLIPSFPSCNVPNDPTANFLTGVELGTAVVTAIVTAVVIRRMWRGN